MGRILVLVALIAACGGDAVVVDAPPGDGCEAPLSQCNPIEQTGCRSDDDCKMIHDAEDPARFAVVPCWGSFASGCFPSLPAPAGLGETCELIERDGDTCGAGLFCRNGRCVALCLRPEPPCPDGFCIFDGVPGQCAPACDPAQPEPCPAGEACVEQNGAFGCTPA